MKNLKKTLACLLTGTVLAGMCAFSVSAAEAETLTLDALADGALGGQALAGNGYVGWMGHGADATGEEGTVTFTVGADKAGEWGMTIYYLSKPSSSGIANANVRDFVVTVNDEVVETVTCPEGTSWDNPAAAVTIDLENTITLKDVENTIKLGNPDNAGPTLVKIELTKVADAGADDGTQTPGGNDQQPDTDTTPEEPGTDTTPEPDTGKQPGEGDDTTPDTGKQPNEGDDTTPPQTGDAVLVAVAVAIVALAGGIVLSKKRHTAE